MSEFNPLKLIEEAVASGYDPAMVSDVDERQLPWARNVVSWVMDTEFLNTKTIFPSQLQVMLRLFGDVCPYCSDWDSYQKDWEPDANIGNVLSKIQLLDDGKCPKCKKTRIDQYNDKHYHFPDEIDILWGMRCIPKTSLVFTHRGIMQFQDVNEGDLLTHGPALQKIDSGILPSIKATTEYNWTLTGAKETHIVPVLNDRLELEHKLLRECSVGDVLVLYSPDMWSKESFKLGSFKRESVAHNFPAEVTPEVARLVGYLVSNGQYTSQYNLRIMSSDPCIDADIKRCCLAVFGEEPRLEEYRECETVPFYKCWTVNGVAVMEWLRFIGLEPQTARGKYIPDFILCSPKEIVCEFLAGLFGEDGGVHVETMPNGRKKVLLYYTTASQKLMEQLRVILLNLGIVTRCSKFESVGFGKANKYDETTRPEYTISTKSAEYVRLFAENVHLASDEKRRRLDLAKTIKGRAKYSTQQGTYTYKTAPEALKKLVDAGYFPVKITDLRDGPPLDMMDIQVPGTNVYTADGFVHHNSGKSAVCGGLIGSYVLHRYLRLPDPAAYFDLLPGSELYMRFVAMTLRQAKQSNWMYFTSTVRRCDWFNQYHDFMSYFSRKKGVELVRWVLEGFAYVHKGIVGYVVGSGNYDVERGRTAAFTDIDEIGLFDGDIDSTQFNPHETYTTYEKASATVRSAARYRFRNGDCNTPTAWMAVQSSTKSKSDYIMRLIKQGKTDVTKVTAHKASWEVNPKLDITFLENEKRKDPRTFDRDYGSIPPFADDPFIDDEELVLKCATLEPRYWNIKKEATARKCHLNATALDLSKNIPYCLSIDMGRSECGYAVSLLKLKEDDFSVVQVEALWGLYVAKPQIVDFDSMFNEFVLPVCEKLNVKLVLYDQWQSLAHIDALAKMKIDAQQYSMTYKDFLQFRSNLYQGKLETLKPEASFEEVERSSRPVEELLYERPALHLLWQMLSVSEIGTKLTKGSGHDDLFRALALGCTFLWDVKLRKSFEYKGGVPLHKGRLGEGLVISGGSRAGTGHMYQSGLNRQTTNNNTSVVSTSNGTLGSFMGRTKRPL